MSYAKITLIAGPTAAGKSALALDLARKQGGVIINADAMQIYAGLPILSAQPSVAERSDVPHELYGILDPGERSSAGRWLALARDAINRTVASKRLPVLVGGTGLYFRALLGGLAEMPDVPQSVRDDAEKMYDDLGEEKFRKELAKLDPVSAAKFAPNDRQRSIRAYEIVKHTGRPIGEWQKSGKGDTPYKPDIHLVVPPRDELYAACDRRFTQMVANGAVEETRAFLAHNVDPTLPAMKTIGLRELGAYLQNECSLDEATAKGQQATRNYAKRQLTWFRNQKL